MPVELFATPDQIQVISCTARNIALIAGRRWGKTDTFFNRAAKRLLEAPITYAYIAPAYSQVENEYERMCRLLREFIHRAVTQPVPKIWFANGSTIEFRSFDRPNNIRSRGLDEVWIDEIQNIKEREFWPVIRPLVADKRGTIVISGQFRGKNWYYHAFYTRGQSNAPKDRQYKSFCFPSWTGIRFQGPEGKEEIEAMRDSLPRMVFLQEVACEPIAGQYGAFMPEDIEACIGGLTLSAKQAGHTYIMGLDLGRTRDPSAIIVVEVKTGQIVHAEKLQLGTPHETQARYAAQVQRRFAAAVVCDATGGATGGHGPADQFVKLYRAAMPGLREFYLNERTKERICQELGLSFEKRRVQIPASCTELLHELRTMEAHYKGGRWRYSAPDGEHDDLVLALALAEHGRHAGWGPSTGASVPLSTF